MALVWIPLALANTAWTVWRMLHVYGGLRGGTSMPGILGWLRVDPVDFHDLVTMLPAPPVFGRIWPWLGLVVPLGVLGTWLHHAVWDHLGLWLLGGLKERRGFYREAETPDVGVTTEVNDLVEFDPIGRKYIYGDEEEAAQDAAYVLYDVWGLDPQAELLVTASAFDGPSWEKDTPLKYSAAL